MRITRSEPKEFRPITIIIETKDEADVMASQLECSCNYANQKAHVLSHVIFSKYMEALKE